MNDEPIVRKREISCIVLGLFVGAFMGYNHSGGKIDISTAEKFVLSIPALAYAGVAVPSAYRSDDPVEKGFRIAAGVGIGALATAIGYGLGYIGSKMSE